MCSAQASREDAAILHRLPDPGFFPKEWANQGVACNQKCRPRLSPFSMAWYSQQLLAAGEPSLYNPGRRMAEQLRFTWLRSFDPPITVRIVMDDSGYRLIAKQLSGAGGYDPGEIVQSVDRMLDRKERDQIDGVRASELFAPDPEGCLLGLDGAQWIIESSGNAGYRFGERHSPAKGAIREAGLTMLGLTGWKFEPVY